MNSELPHLQHLVKMPPRTATGRVTAAWAVIRSNLAAGKSLREVYEAAKEDGLDVAYAQFRVYVHRLRKRDLRRGLAPVSVRSHGPTKLQKAEPQRDAPEKLVRPLPGAPSDPLRNVREQRARKNSFEYDPFPAKGLTL
jgi:hypothetical protein